MKWFIDNANFVGVLVAAIAVGLTFTTVMISRQQRRQDIFLRVQDMLTALDLQRGRRLLYNAGRAGRLDASDSSDYELMNRTLAFHNTVAEYVRRGVIPRRWVLHSWHHTLRDMRPGASLFIEHRQQTHGWRVWAELENLIDLAEKYRTSRPCCRGQLELTGATEVDRRPGIHSDPESGARPS